MYNNKKLALRRHKGLQGT